MGNLNILSIVIKLGTAYHKIKSQTCCDKVVSRKGNSPDYINKSPEIELSEINKKNIGRQLVSGFDNNQLLMYM